MKRREMFRKSVWNMARGFPAILVATERVRGWGKNLQRHFPSAEIGDGEIA